MSERVTVVVPCYNEERRLDVGAFQRFLGDDVHDTRFLFVDDGSRDGTLRVLDQLRTVAPDRIGILQLDANRGKAEAVRLGVLAAMDEGAALVAYWDADLATPLNAIRQFASVLENRPELGMVMGSRIQLLGRHIERKLTRHYLGRAFATTVSLVLGLRVYDTQCGAKMFRVTPDLRPIFGEPFRSRWIFDVEILARLIAARRGDDSARLENYIYELPLMEWRDVHGSKLRGSDFAAAGPQLARIWWTYLRRGAPAARAQREARRELVTPR